MCNLTTPDKDCVSRGEGMWIRVRGLGTVHVDCWGAVGRGLIRIDSTIRA